MLVAVDFDGTIRDYRAPHAGELIPGAQEGLWALAEAGHKIILWTCRTGFDLQDAAEYVDNLGVDLHGVNHNDINDDFGAGGIKVHADIYIDDMAAYTPKLPGRTCIDWSRVMEWLKEQNYI